MYSVVFHSHFTKLQRPLTEDEAWLVGDGWKDSGKWLTGNEEAEEIIYTWDL